MLCLLLSLASTAGRPFSFDVHGYDDSARHPSRSIEQGIKRGLGQLILCRLYVSPPLASFASFPYPD